jgi:hypothetical protein
MSQPVKADRSRFGIVVTTIGVGDFLGAYRDLVAGYSEPDDVTLYIIGDMNTREECRRRAESIAAEGLRFLYIDPERQEKFLAPFPELSAAIPYRSDNRRNIGYLLALRDGAEVIISIDDDSYPLSEHPFLEHHGKVGKVESLPRGDSANSWFNVGCMLASRDGEGRSMTLYPRGYPYARRGTDRSHVTASSEERESSTGMVGINLGLWLGEPDIDAVTRLATRCRASTMTAPSCMLGRGLRTPISSQNSAVCRQAIPAYYFVLQGARIGGLPINRFGDVFGGYFAQLCAEAVGHRVRVGQPCIEQRRNRHDPYVDLAVELPGMVVLDAMLPILEEPLHPASSYAEAYCALADRIDRWAGRSHGFLWDEGTKAFFAEVTRTMRLWTRACAELTGGESRLAVKRL